MDFDGDDAVLLVSHGEVLEAQFFERLLAELRVCTRVQAFALVRVEKVQDFVVRDGGLGSGR